MHGNGSSRAAWLLLADRSGLADALVRELANRNEETIVVTPTRGEPRFQGNRWDLDLHSPEQVRRTCERIRAEGREIRAIVHLLGLDATPVEDTTVESLARDQEHALLSLLPLCQSLAVRSLPGPARLWIVTRLAVPASSRQGGVNLAQAPLWGMGRALALEQPDLWGGLLDLDREDAAPAARRLIEEICASDGEDQVAWRADQRLVPRLAPMRAPDAAPITLHEHRTYLVTGAFGNLGAHLVRKLVARGARDLILVSRRGASTPQAAALLSELGRAGVEARVVQADVGQPLDLERLTSVVESSPRPLAGVFHVAGVIAFESLNELTPEKFREVLGPKVIGAFGLHRLSMKAELDHFLCFSSIASVWGSLGQIHYAAANQFLDALAHHRRAEALPALSASFGVWDAGGKLYSHAKAFFERAGIRPMSIDRGLSMVEVLLAQPAPHVVCADLDWRAFRGAIEKRRPRPLFEEMGADQGSTAVEVAPSAPSLPERILSSDPDRRLDLMVDYVQGRVAELMGFSSELPDVDLGFFDLGMDSLMSLALRTHLQEDLGLELSTTAALENPTIRRLASFVLAQLPGVEQAPALAAQDARLVHEDRVLIDSVKEMTDGELERIVTRELEDLGLE